MTSDLAVAYIEQFDLKGGDGLIRALKYARTAVEIDPRSPTAHFNFALALEKNKLYHQAAQVWKEYLSLEHDPRWKREASEHLRRVTKASRSTLWEERKKASLLQGFNRFDLVVAEFPDLARHYAEEELLPLWAEEWLAGRRSDAQRHLRALRGFGVAIASRFSDRFLLDSVAAVDLAWGDSDWEGLNSIALSVRGLASGLSACLEGRALVGLHLVKDGLATMNQGNTPLLYRGHLFEAICIYQSGDLNSAILKLDRLLGAGIESRYPSIIGKSYWIKGLCQILRGNPYAALKSYEAAQRIYEALLSYSDVGVLDYLTAECLYNLGDSRRLWALLYRGLGATIEAGDLFHEYTALDAVADAAARDGFYNESIYFRDEVVRIAELTPDAPSLAHAYLKRARDFHHLGESSRALIDLEVAEKACRSIDDVFVQGRWLAEVLVAEALIKISDDPESAFRLLGQALNIYRGKRIALWMIDIHKERARALVAAGDFIGARKEFLSGIAEFEQRRSEVIDDEMRREFFLKAAELFDGLIDLASAEGADGVLALDIAERSRGIQFHEATSRLTRSSGHSPSRFLDIGRKLPKDVTVIAYSALDEGLVIWALDNSLPVKMVRTIVGAKQLKAHILALREAINLRQQDALSAEARWLFGTLVKPVESLISESRVLVIVPDKVIHEVPFAVLQDPYSNRYLLEDFRILVSPSVDDLRPGAQLLMSGHDAGGAMIVGDPAFSRVQFPGLSRLRGADREAVEVAQFYAGNSRLLLGVDATKNNFLHDVGSYSVVHVASHIVPNSEFPDYSRLVLASRTEADGFVTPPEIARCDLSNTQVVVLAGCRSAYGLIDRSEGPLSFVRAFLMGGAQTVIGSLWDIPDNTSVRLLTAFHANFALTRSSVEALRKAQLSMLHSGDPVLESPEVWGGLQVYGTFFDM